MSAWDAGDTGSIPGLGRSPGEGNGNPLQYSCLDNPMNRGAWGYGKQTVGGRKEAGKFVKSIIDSGKRWLCLSSNFSSEDSEK